MLHANKFRITSRWYKYGLLTGYVTGFLFGVWFVSIITPLATSYN